MFFDELAKSFRLGKKNDMSNGALELALFRYHRKKGIMVMSTQVPEGYNRIDDGREPIAKDAAEIDMMLHNDAMIRMEIEGILSMGCK